MDWGRTLRNAGVAGLTLAATSVIFQQLFGEAGSSAALVLSVPVGLAFGLLQPVP